MQQPAGPSRNEQIKQSVFSQFQLNRDPVGAFQQPGQNDPTRGQISARTQSLQKIWTAFELYKVQTLKNYMRQDARAGFNAEAREQSFAYYDSVQDVMRAMIYGAKFSDLSRAVDIVPELQRKIAVENPYAEALVLLAQMIPPKTERGQAIQTDLARLLKGLLNTKGNLGAVEKQIDPHLPVSVDKSEALLAAGEAVRKAREAARGSKDFTPD